MHAEEERGLRALEQRLNSLSPSKACCVEDVGTHRRVPAPGPQMEPRLPQARRQSIALRVLTEGTTQDQKSAVPYHQVSSCPLCPHL